MVRARRAVAVLGFVLVIAALCFSFAFLTPVDRSFAYPGWQEFLGWTALTYAVGWALVWLGLPDCGLEPKDSRAPFGFACAFMIAAAAFALMGLRQQEQWRDYRDAPRSEQPAVVESIRVDTSPPVGPPGNSYPEPGQALEVRLADGSRQKLSVPKPPLVPDDHRTCEYVSSDVTYETLDKCKVPVTARVYGGGVAQLTLPSGQKTDTDQQPGRHRLVACLGALCLLGAVWPPLPLWLKLRRAGRADGTAASH